MMIGVLYMELFIIFDERLKVKVKVKVNKKLRLISHCGAAKLHFILIKHSCESDLIRRSDDE